MYLKAFSLLDKKNKRRVYIIFFLMILAGGVAALGIGLIIPLVKMLIDQNFLNNFIFLKDTLLMLKGLIGENNLNIIFLYLFLIIYLIKNIYLIFYTYYQSRLILNIQFNISLNLFKKYVFSSTLYMAQKKSSEIIRNVITQSDSYALNFIQSTLSIAVETIIFFSILMVMFFHF